MTLTSEGVQPTPEAPAKAQAEANDGQSKPAEASKRSSLVEKAERAVLDIEQKAKDLHDELVKVEREAVELRSRFHQLKSEKGE